MALPYLAALTVHAAVLYDPQDGERGERAAHAIERLLFASGGYDVVDDDVLAGRLGEKPDDLWQRCAGDIRCWRAEASALGLEQVVLVEYVDEGTLGLRVVDVASTATFRRDKAAIVEDEPEAGLVERLFFRPGSVSIAGAPPAANVLLDGAPPVRLTLELAAGKHALEVTADGYAPWFAAFMVYPEQQTELDVALTPIASGRSRILRWTTWVGLGIAAAGVGALALGADADGVASRPPAH